MKNLSFRKKILFVPAVIIAFGMMFSNITYAQTASSATSTIGYFYAASGQMIDAEDNNGVMSSYLTRGERNDGTSETFAVSNIKDITADLDSNGNIINKYTYTAYGTQTSYNSNTQINESTNSQLSLSSNPFIYDGYYTDAESGNYYLNARYYNPTLGIFLTSDSYNLPNRYMYVNGNPVLGVDPTGHSWEFSCMHYISRTDSTDGDWHFGSGSLAESRFYKSADKPGSKMDSSRHDYKQYEDMITVDEIRSNNQGKYQKIGEGYYGTAFKRGDRVYKIYHDIARREMEYDKAQETKVERSARIANELGYDDVYALDGGNVLSSPFAVTGTKAIRKHDFYKLAQQLDDQGFIMSDFKPDNVGYVGGILRVIDYDHCNRVRTGVKGDDWMQGNVKNNLKAQGTGTMAEYAHKVMQYESFKKFWI